MFLNIPARGIESIIDEPLNLHSSGAHPWQKLRAIRLLLNSVALKWRRPCQRARPSDEHGSSLRLGSIRPSGSFHASLRERDDCLQRSHSLSSGFGTSSWPACTQCSWKGHKWLQRAAAPPWAAYNIDRTLPFSNAKATRQASVAVRQGNSIPQTNGTSQMHICCKKLYVCQGM